MFSPITSAVAAFDKDEFLEAIVQEIELQSSINSCLSFACIDTRPSFPVATFFLRGEAIPRGLELSLTVTHACFHA